MNDVVATTIAASFAAATDLAVAPNAAELAVSTRVQSEYNNSSSDASTISKPAIVQLSTGSRQISEYVAVEGDTVQSIADKHGVTAQTIRWANNLTGDTVTVGAKIQILPRDGIAYTVKDGDTIQAIADKYKADVTAIATFNDLEINGIAKDLKIIIPDGTLPDNERPGYVNPVRQYSSSTSGGYITGVGAWDGNVLGMRLFYGVNANSGGYAPGNCTAYAFFRRAELGMPIPRMMGNASSWAVSARAAGYVVNKTPSVGAVIQAGNHVGVVEEVFANGDLRITDMNYGYRIYNLANRIIPASTVHNYMFIH